IGHVQRGLHLDHDFSCSNLTGNTVFPGFPLGNSAIPASFGPVRSAALLFVAGASSFRSKDQQLVATQRPWVEILRVFPQHVGLGLSLANRQSGKADNSSVVIF
ncbi:MAG: hypothetical protein ACN6PF_06255, partial [Achromobacter veterisilvae]